MSAKVVEEVSAIYPEKKGNVLAEEDLVDCEGAPCIAARLEDGRVRVELPRRLVVLDARDLRPSWSRKTFMDFEITDSALSDFCRVTGRPLLESARQVLADEFRKAHYSRTTESGVELWRGRRPFRLRFAVQVSGRKYVVTRVTSATPGAVTIQRPQRFEVIADGEPVTLEVVQHFFERGGERRVAFWLAGGEWAEARRGGGLREVRGLRRHLQARPAWVELDRDWGEEKV